MGAGRLRSRAAWITNDGSGKVVFQPPDPDAIPDLVDQIGQALEAAEWHPAVAAAWVHVAIAAVHPFLDGNGRTARVLASLAMYRGGFRHTAFTNLEEWWGKNPADYYGAFACLGTEFDPRADVTPFVVDHLTAQMAQVVQLALRQRAEGMLWTALENLLDDHKLPSRLANALYDSFFDRAVTTGYYQSLIDASPATARNDLVTATAAGLLRSEGRTRGRRYRPGPKLVEALATTVGVAPVPDAIVGELVRRVTNASDWPYRPKP